MKSGILRHLAQGWGLGRELNYNCDTWVQVSNAASTLPVGGVVDHAKNLDDRICPVHLRYRDCQTPGCS